MLVLRKMSAKKLGIYLALMCLMLAGTGLMLFENYKLSSNSRQAANLPARFDAAMTGGTALPQPAAPLTAASQAPAAAPLDLNKLKNDSGLDLTIFENEKFKNLQNNFTPGAELPAAGKRDPFQLN